MRQVALEGDGQKGAKRPNSQHAHSYVEYEPMLLHARDAVKERYDRDLAEANDEDEEEVAGVVHLLNLRHCIRRHQMQ